MITNSKEYDNAVDTIRGLMSDMTTSFFGGLVMTQYIWRFACQTTDEKHRSLPWRKDNDTSDLLIVGSVVVAIVSWLLFGFFSIWFDNLPTFPMVLISAPPLMLFCHAVYFQLVGYRTLIEARESFLLMADELGPRITRKVIQERIVLLERGFTLSGRDYLELAACLLNEHICREKERLQSAYVSEYGGPENPEVNNTEDQEDHACDSDTSKEHADER